MEKNQPTSGLGAWRRSPASRSIAANHSLAALPQGTETLGQTCGFWLDVGERLHGFRVLLSAPLAVVISGAATSRPAPATLLAAMRHPAQAVKLLRVQSCHPAYPALPALHLSRASSR